MDQATTLDSTIFDKRLPRLDYTQILFLLAILVVLHTLAVFSENSPVRDRQFTGPDAYSRMVRVQDLLETGDWFDPTYTRVNPPHGHLTHWSRPMDAAIAAGTGLLSMVFAQPDALYWAGAAISPLFHLLTLLVLILGMRPLFGNNWTTFCGLLFLVQAPLLQAFNVARPDHQSLQLLLTALMIVAAFHLLLRPFNRYLCYGLGAVFALSLWASVEILLPVVGVVGGLTLAWVIWRRDFARKGFHLALSALASTLVALFLERGPQYLDDMTLEVDRLSMLHVLHLVLLLGFWTVLRLWDRRRRDDSRPTARVMAVTACGIIGLGMLWLIQPEIFAGHYGTVDPLYRLTRSRHISESQPAYLPGSLETFGFGFVVQRIGTYFGYSLLGVLFLSFILVHPRTDRHELWIVIASIFGVVMLFTIIQQKISLRDSPILGLVLLFPYAEMVARIYEWLSRRTTHGAAVLRATSLLALVMWPHVLGRAIEMAQPSVAARSNLEERLVIKACPVTEMARYLGEAETWRDPPRWVMAHVDFGPEILYRTNHRVFSIPNHRLQTGYTDTYRAMSATTDEAARVILQRREVDLVLLCRSRSLDSFYRRTSEVSSPNETIFRERLLNDQLPIWLKPVPLPDDLGNGFILLEVDRAALNSN